MCTGAFWAVLSSFSNKAKELGVKDSPGSKAAQGAETVQRGNRMPARGEKSSLTDHRAPFPKVWNTSSPGGGFTGAHPFGSTPEGSSHPSTLLAELRPPRCQAPCDGKGQSSFSRAPSADRSSGGTSNWGCKRGGGGMGR